MWNNKPATGASLGSKTITTTSGQWYEWDVTAYLQQQRLAGATGVSFALKANVTSDPWMIFNSEENALNKPRAADYRLMRRAPASNGRARSGRGAANCLGMRCPFPAPDATVARGTGGNLHVYG